MAKIDVYLKSIERFGAAGAVLSSGQAVTLRFPQGDRTATQVTPHDQLVGMVREVAPPNALDQIDKNRIAKFDVDSSGVRYTLSVSPRPGMWHVTIDGPAAPVATPPLTTPIPRQPRAASPAAALVAEAGEMAIERGQYGEAPRQNSGSGMLDQWTSQARSARATDVVLATGAPPALRGPGGELQPLGGALDAETISRELGVVAPAEARSAWTEHGLATFAYGDGVGRVRATLTRDHRGPGASLRLLVGEPPTIDRLGLAQVGPWLDRRGLVLVAGPAGCGKTTTLAALVRALGDRNKRVVTFEDPIEILQASPWVSQRAVGAHVADISVGVAAALREGADAIAIGGTATEAAAAAALDAVIAGQLVLTTLAGTAKFAVDELVDRMPASLRDRARSALGRSLVGTISPVVKNGTRSFEVLAASG